MPIRIGIGFNVAFLLAITTSQAQRINVGNVSNAVAEYLEVLNRLPERSTFVRVRYPMSGTRKRFQLQGIAVDPLAHVDSIGAVLKVSVSLSDYPAATLTFPVVYRSQVLENRKWEIVDLEGNGPHLKSQVR